MYFCYLEWYGTTVNFLVYLGYDLDNVFFAKFYLTSILLSVIFVPNLYHAFKDTYFHFIVCSAVVRLVFSQQLKERSLHTWSLPSEDFYPIKNFLFKLWTVF